MARHHSCDDWCWSMWRKLCLVHELLSSLMQLHGVVNSSGMMGSVSRVWGAVIVRVVPTCATARRSMSKVEFEDCVVDVVLRMEPFVT